MGNKQSSPPKTTLPKIPPPKPVYIAPPKPIYIAPPKPIYIAPPKPIYIAPPKPIYIAPPKPIYIAPPKPIYIAPPKPIYIAPPPKSTLPKIHIAPVVIPKQKIDMGALQKSVGIIAGVVSLFPPAKLAVTAIVGIADASDKGSASKYLNSGHSTNSTLNMLPGGFLVQNVANLASNGKSGTTLAKITPDPVKMGIKDTIKITQTIITHPKNTLSVGKSLVAENITTIKPTLHNIISPVSHTLSVPVVAKEQALKPSLIPVYLQVKPVIQAIPISTLTPKNIIPIISHLPIVSTISKIIPPPPPPPQPVIPIYEPIYKPIYEPIHEPIHVPIVNTLSNLQVTPPEITPPGITPSDVPNSTLGMRADVEYEGEEYEEEEEEYEYEES